MLLSVTRSRAPDGLGDPSYDVARSCYFGAGMGVAFAQRCFRIAKP